MEVNQPRHYFETWHQNDLKLILQVFKVSITVEGFWGVRGGFVQVQVYFYKVSMHNT